MINYYKFRLGFYKLDTISKSFSHINNAENNSLISLVTNEESFDKLLSSITNNVGGYWEVISENDFNFAKQEVLTKLN
jgi:hypothetical protein